MIAVHGKCGISAGILADSINCSGQRLTTFELVYPRWILAEFNTHRVISKNSASSRAVPYQKAIDQIETQMAMPVYYGKNMPGMKAKEELSELEIQGAKGIWESAFNSVKYHTNILAGMNLHKQTINRLAEPWSMMKTVATATDWDNFFWLRNDEDAQPEFRELASKMFEAMQISIPTILSAGEWHLPYIDIYRDSFDHTILHYMDSTGQPLSIEDAIKVSASCCAQVSYRNLNETKEKALEIYAKLFSGSKPHMSPTEHQGTPITVAEHDKLNPLKWVPGITHITRDAKLYSGNLAGWIQYRQTLPNNVYRK